MAEDSLKTHYVPKSERESKRLPSAKKIQVSCESCEYYDYDEDSDAYVCQMSLDEEYTFDIATPVGRALAQTIEGLILAPRLSNVNEGGFSMSWDFTNLGSYYLYLCKKWDVEVNEDVLAASGMSAITDKTEMW